MKKPAKKKVHKKSDKPLGDYEVGYKKPPIEHKIKKGQVLNPLGAGSPAHRLKQITKKTLKDGIEFVMTHTEAECVALLQDPNVELGMKTIINSALDAAHHGKWEKFRTILADIIGNVPEKVEIESPDGSMSPKQVQFFVPENGRE